MYHKTVDVALDLVPFFFRAKSESFKASHFSPLEVASILNKTIDIFTLDSMINIDEKNFIALCFLNANISSRWHVPCDIFDNPKNSKIFYTFKNRIIYFFTTVIIDQNKIEIIWIC
ncbi:hypothetical protein ASE75_10475 [Sphingomonas sp. Leaf17]|nr:hypothetical protein ASE75_10475 [Sphingomonas sp. Leaf17]